MPAPGSGMQPSQGNEPWPVGLASGGSPGAANAQPACSSWPGRVSCQVGCVTDRPITSCRPCRRGRVAGLWAAVGSAPMHVTHCAACRGCKPARQPRPHGACPLPVPAPLEPAAPSCAAPPRSGRPRGRPARRTGGTARLQRRGWSEKGAQGWCLASCKRQGRGSPALQLHCRKDRGLPRRPAATRQTPPRSLTGPRRCWLACQSVGASKGCGQGRAAHRPPGLTLGLVLAALLHPGAVDRLLASKLAWQGRLRGGNAGGGWMAGEPAGAGTCWAAPAVWLAAAARRREPWRRLPAAAQRRPLTLGTHFVQGRACGL